MLALTHATVGAPVSPEITLTVPASVLKAYDPPNSCPIEKAGSVYGLLSFASKYGPNGHVPFTKVGQNRWALALYAVYVRTSKLASRVLYLSAEPTSAILPNFA